MNANPTGANKTWRLTINGRLPSVNEYINAERTNKHLAAAMKKNAQTFISWQIKRDLPDAVIDEPVWISFDWYAQNRKSDPDNICGIATKFILDSLVKCKVLEDDGWKHILGFRHSFYINKEQTGVDIIFAKRLGE